MYAMIFGTSLLFPAALIEGLPKGFAQMNWELAVLVIFLGVFGGALGYFFWTFALSRLTPTQVAVYVNVNPMVAILLSSALLTKKLTNTFLVGFMAVMVGVLFVNWPKKLKVQ
jgi:drug/metabolite transporter (DMT)-like permease